MNFGYGLRKKKNGWQGEVDVPARPSSVLFSTKSTSISLKMCSSDICCKRLQKKGHDIFI